MSESQQTNNAPIELRVSIQEALGLVQANGSNRTYLLSGTPGIGKTERIKQMAHSMGYNVSILDAASMDLGELAMPYFSEVKNEEASETVKVTKFAPNARLMIHSTKPVVIFIDELGKANPIVMNMLLPILQEHRVGDFNLPEGSIVVAATNLASDGLGDRIPPHAYNRMTELLVRGPTADEWIKWAVGAGMPAGLIATIKQNPSLLQEYWMPNAESNKYIFNPRTGQTRNFSSARSLAGIAHEVRAFEQGAISTAVFNASLVGAVGRSAADTISAYLSFGSKLPSMEEVVENPNRALEKALNCIAGQHLMVAGLAMRVDKTTVDPVCQFVKTIRENNMQEASILFARLVSQRQDSGMVGVKESKEMRSMFVALATDLA